MDAPAPGTAAEQPKPQVDPPTTTGLTGPADRRMQERRTRGVVVGGVAFRRVGGA